MMETAIVVCWGGGPFLCEQNPVGERNHFAFFNLPGGSCLPNDLFQAVF